MPGRLGYLVNMSKPAKKKKERVGDVHSWLHLWRIIDVDVEWSINGSVLINAWRKHGLPTPYTDPPPKGCKHWPPWPLCPPVWPRLSVDRVTLISLSVVTPSTPPTSTKQTKYQQLKKTRQKTCQTKTFATIRRTRRPVECCYPAPIQKRLRPHCWNEETTFPFPGLHPNLYTASSCHHRGGALPPSPSSADMAES